MEPLHSSLLISNRFKNKTIRRFHYEEQREIRQWYKTNQSQLSSIRDDPRYLYKGVFVQTEPRSSFSTNTPAKKTKKRPKSPENPLISADSKTSTSPDQTTSTVDEREEDEDALEANLTIDPLRFRGLYTRNLYDVLGRLRPKYQPNTKDFKDLSTDNLSDSEQSSDSESEKFYTPAFEINEDNSKKGLDTDDLEISTFHLLKDQKKRISKNVGNPESLDDSLRHTQKNLFFRREINGIESFPQSLKVGKIRRESPRVQQLMRSLSPSTLNFLSRNRSKNSNFDHCIFSQEDDVFVNFHSQTKLRDNWVQKPTETLTAKQMVTNILYKSILDKKYELARRALGIYIRHDDSDIRLIYSAALKILEHRKANSNNNISNQNNDTMFTGIDEIPEDEELIRWMIVAYPSMIEYFQLTRSYPKNVEYAQLYVIRMLRKPNPNGYNEAIDYLDDLLRKAPYLDEPVFYLLRAYANTQYAYDENADAAQRLKAIDSVFSDYRKVHEIGGEGFYPKDLVSSLQKNLEKLQESLANDESS